MGRPATSHFNQTPCLATKGISTLPHGVSVGLDFMSHLMMDLGLQEPQMVSQGQMCFCRRFLQDKSLPQQISFSYGGPSGGTATSWRHDVTSPQNSALYKHGSPRSPEAFIVLGTSMPLSFQTQICRRSYLSWICPLPSI
ncbi:B-cell CLL/lymphoma 9 protein-like [Moschus berezovskii]|uniref:B-cell CLL/lymphoma 9 protein-like n=1 Tax=Moschus berezovskii TaxID=68408 RepID=UPI0024445C1B|nr:B-cell CLL/lymphoma 9 protein-like [Moschus berezovskii]